MTYPIVLAHGIARFDVLGNKFLQLDNTPNQHLDCMHYFKCMRTMLMSHGYEVWHSRVPWAAGVEVRSEQLRLNILDVLGKTANKADKVNIIAHSMGGLDARHMLFNDRNNGRIHERVASLVTISTPHEGSSAADWMFKNLTEVTAILKNLGIATEGLKDVTPSECTTFNNNPEVVAFEGAMSTKVITYAGQSTLPSTLGILKPLYMLLEQQEGPNDGLVSVKAAMWRGQPHRRIWEDTDHLNELGHWDFDQITAREMQGHLLARIHENYLSIAQALP